MENYENDDNPLNGNLTEVVHGEFIGESSPSQDRGTLKATLSTIMMCYALYDNDVRRKACKIAPAFFIDLFKDAGVTDVIRLNEARYDPSVFAAAGIRHHDLFFEDCTTPPGHILVAFLSIVNAATAQHRQYRNWSNLRRRGWGGRGLVGGAGTIAKSRPGRTGR